MPARQDPRDARKPRARPSAGGRFGARSAPKPAARAEVRTARPPDIDHLLGRQPWSRLREWIPGEGAAVDATLARERTLARMLLEWNRGVSNLISRHDEIRLVERHFLESLAPARLLIDSGCERFVDFGSGGGFPALPLALAGVGKTWTLVEARRNKTLFLRKVKQDMKLDNIDVLTDRLEVLVERDPQMLECDAFTSRATALMAPTLALGAQIVRPGGTAFLWKGSSHTEELSHEDSPWRAHWRLERSEVIGAGPNVVCIFTRL